MQDRDTTMTWVKVTLEIMRSNEVWYIFLSECQKNFLMDYRSGMGKRVVLV